MKTLSTFTALSLLVSAHLAEGAVVEGRIYKVGEVEQYSTVSTMSRPGFKLKTRGLLTQRVLKVYENGDADIETTTTKMFYKFIGDPKANDMPASIMNREFPSSKEEEKDYKTLHRLTPLGAMRDTSGESDILVTAIQMTWLSLKDKKGLKAGQTLPLTVKEGDSSLRGTTIILGVSGSFVRSATKLGVDGISYKMEISSKVDRSNYRIVSLSAILTGFASKSKSDKDGFDRIEFAMTRI